MDPVDDDAFVVGLTELDLKLMARGGRAAQRLDVLQIGRAILLRLASAEQVEVRAVEHVDFFRHEFAGVATRASGRRASSSGTPPTVKRCGPYRDLARKGKVERPRRKPSRPRA